MPFRIPLHPLRSCRGRFVVLIVFLAGIARAEETTVEGTMPEDYLPGLRVILEKALKESPAMIANELQIAAADAQKGMSGISPMLPSVSISPGYGKSVETVSGNSGASSGENGVVYNGNIRQNLFEWGSLRNQLGVQQILKLIAEKNYAEGYRNFVATLRRAYLTLVVEKVDLRNAGYARDLSNQALALARDKLKHGTISQTDIAEPELDADEKQLAFDRAQESYEFARRTLAHQVGMNDIPDDTIPLGIPAPRYSAETSAALLADLMREGAQDTFLAQIDRLNIEQWDLNYKIARVRLLPQIYATAGISQQSNTYATSSTVQQTLVTNKSYYIDANWTLFDGLATHWAKVQALTEKRYYQRQLEIQVDSTMDQAQNSEHLVDFAWRALSLADRRWQMAGGYLGHARAELKLGNLSQDDVAAATNGLYLNESALNAARADFLSSWGDFVSLVGADPAMNNLPVHYVRDLR